MIKMYYTSLWKALEFCREIVTKLPKKKKSTNMWLKDSYDHIVSKKKKEKPQMT